VRLHKKGTYLSLQTGKVSTDGPIKGNT